MATTIQLSTPQAGILHIKLNRPQQLNALSHDVLTELNAAFTTAKQDQSIRAILLSGEGKGFCAGADIKELQAINGAQGLAFAKFGQSVFRQLETLGKPSLAAIHGFAFGGGCELAMAATMRMAAENTQFGQPEIKLGVIPGFGGTQRLARLVGKGRALELCLTGRRFSAQEALQWGFLTMQTTAEKLEMDAINFLQQFTNTSAVAVNAIMSAIHEGYDLPYGEAEALEAAYFGICCQTADKQEGVTAFLEKRPAIFKGDK